jgi:hypothetical protein
MTLTKGFCSNQFHPQPPPLTPPRHASRGGRGTQRPAQDAGARPHVPNVERWYRTLAERPAYRAHVMVPFAELEGRLEY